MTARQGVQWQPSDDELDGLAHTLEVPELRVDEAEQHRTMLLANAANVRQLSRHSRTPIVVSIAVGIAAAAAMLLWFGLRPHGEAPRVDAVALGDASFAHEQRWPEYVLRVDDGRVAIDVANVDDGHTFIARTHDARVVTRSSQFVVGAETGRLTTVDVKRGRVELRYQGQTIILATGQSWRAAIRTAEVMEDQQVEVAAPAPSQRDPGQPDITDSSASSTAQSSDGRSPSLVVGERATLSTPRKRPQAPTRIADAATTRHQSPTKQTDSTSTKQADSPPSASSTPERTSVTSAAKPGELDFRTAVAALRTGDAAAATRSFIAACAAAKYDALGEDACFWVGAAANRAGQSAIARDALIQFLAEFPSSARTGEASALLGWLLYNAGELDAAEPRFRQAAADRVPKVRESAERGLEAIQRKRAATP